MVSFRISNRDSVGLIVCLANPQFSLYDFISGIKQVRIHYLLDMVWWDGPGKWVTDDLLRFMDLLVELNLKPGFEVMGNPGNIFSNFEDRTNLTLWYEMVQQITGEMQGLNLN